MKPIILPIKKIKQETGAIKTFTFEYDLGAEPGQFIMMWIPGVDQKPISISRQTKKQCPIAKKALQLGIVVIEVEY